MRNKDSFLADKQGSINADSSIIKRGGLGGGYCFKGYAWGQLRKMAKVWDGGGSDVSLSTFPLISL